MLHHRLILALLAASFAAHAEVLPFDPAATIGSEAGGIDSAASGDFDGDGDDDIVYASRSNARVSWSRNDRGSYAARATLFSRENVHRLVAADFDLDGRVDLVTATSTGTLAWHRGLRPNASGLAQFETRTAMANGLTGVTQLAAGDINADGRADLIVGRDESPPLHAFVFTGDATDGFAAGVVVPVPTGAGRIAGLGVADFDSNGFADIAATANTAAGSANPTATLFVVPRSNASTFGTPQVVESIISSLDFLTLTYGPLSVADFNGFNGPDLAFIRNSSQGVGEIILRQNGGDSLGTNPGPFRVVLFASTSPIDSLQWADLDRDGDPDVVFNSGPGSDGGWIEGQVLEPFVAHSLGEFFDGGNVRATLVMDDDLDGDPDIVTATETGSVRRLHNRRIHGATRVAQVTRVTTAQPGGTAIAGPWEIVTRRRGLSGDREVVYTEFIGGKVQAFRVAAVLGGGLSVTQDSQPVVDNVGAAREISVFDEAFDGDEDFLLANGESASSSAGNQDRLVFSFNVGANVAASNLVLGCVQGDDLRGVAVGRFAGLGLRVVYAADANDRVALATCPGETTISTAANGVPNAPGVAKLGDLDQDGDLDLLVAARLPDAPPLQGDLVGWYPNTGAGVFGALQRIGVVTGADEATLLDFDRDGRLDVATASNGDPALDPLAGRVLLFRNLGDGAFAPALVAASGMHDAGRIAGADVDHDGDIDLLVPSDSPRTLDTPRTQCGIGLLEALDDGSYALPRCLDGIGLKGRYTRLAVDTLTRDDVPDVVATSFADNFVGVASLLEPQEFTDFHVPLLGNAIMRDGQERCIFAYHVQSHARAADSEIALARYSLDATAPDDAGVLAAVILRRDNGDNQPNPATDVEIGRATAASNGRWDIVVPAPLGNLAAGSPPTRFWACARAAARVPATAQQFTLQLPQATMVDASTLLQLPGVLVDTTTPSFEHTRVFSARVFADGLED